MYAQYAHAENCNRPPQNITVSTSHAIQNLKENANAEYCIKQNNAMILKPKSVSKKTPMIISVTESIAFLLLEGWPHTPPMMVYSFLWG